MKQAFNDSFIREVRHLYEQSEVDFSKFGWVQKVADFRDESPQVIGRRIRRLMPEFYYEKCFSRGNHKRYQKQGGLSERLKDPDLKSGEE